MNLCRSPQGRALAETSEAVNERGVRHFSCFLVRHFFWFHIIFFHSDRRRLDHREVDAVVNIDILDLYTQASSVSADVTDSKLVLADHVNLRLCGEAQFYSWHKS